MSTDSRRPRARSVLPGGPAGIGILKSPKTFAALSGGWHYALRPHRGKTIIVIVMAVLSTVFGIFSPKILGLATSELFESVQQGRAIDFAFIGKVLLALAACMCSALCFLLPSSILWRKSPKYSL